MCSIQLANTYGKVLSVHFGSEKMVLVSGYKMVKEAVVTQAENFVDRPLNAIDKRFYSGTTGVQISISVFCHSLVLQNH